MTKPVRSSGSNVEIFVDSVDVKALRLLESDPTEFFRSTHKRLPFGFAPNDGPKSNG